MRMNCDHIILEQNKIASYLPTWILPGLLRRSLS